MIGKIYLKRRNEQSYNGIAIGILKSGIQKYARRDLLVKGLWCLIELDLFSLLETNHDGIQEYIKRYSEEYKFNVEESALLSAFNEAEFQQYIWRKAKGIRTNLMNRLIVMVSEEISISAYWMPLVINELSELWHQRRGQEISRKYLIDMYKYLISQPKIRLISDLKSVYLLPPDYVKPAQLSDLKRIHAKLMQSLNLSRRYEDCKVVPENLIDSSSLELRSFMDEVDEEQRTIINGILYNIKHQKDHVFYWVNKLIDRQRDAEGKPRFGHKGDSLNIVWQILLEFAEKRERLWNDEPKTYPENFNRVKAIIEVLRKWYRKMTHKEKPIYLYHAILLIVRRDSIDWNLEIPNIDTPFREVEQLYQANLSGKTIAIDDFVYDLHTGQRAKDGREQFAKKGAFIANENRAFLIDDYRLIYHRLKQELDIYHGGKRK